MKIASIIGGRPNIIKCESVHRGLSKVGIEHQIIDFGVYQKPYGQAIYSELELPKPISILNLPENEEYLFNIKYVSSEINRVLNYIHPNALVIYGDLTPSAAAAIAGVNRNLYVIHVEAGLRNYDLEDTEEINRLITDRFSNLLLCTSAEAKNNLIKEGINNNLTHIVGNTIISALKRHISFADDNILKSHNLTKEKYGIVTIHREENLKSPRRLEGIFSGIESIQKEFPLVFIKYSSTNKALNRIGYTNFEKLENLIIIDTVSYHEYLSILRNAKFIITDSSGIQDEAAYLGIPCIICRESTHRINVSKSSINYLASYYSDQIIFGVHEALSKERTKPIYPKEWELNVDDNIAFAIIQNKEFINGKFNRK